MEETKHNLWCTKCKGKENLVKYAYNKKYNRQCYMCRKCNTERARAYYKTPTGQANIYKANKKQWSSTEGRIKQNARMLLNYHVGKGNILKPEYCSVCKKKRNSY